MSKMLSFSRSVAVVLLSMITLACSSVAPVDSSTEGDVVFALESESNIVVKSDELFLGSNVDEYQFNIYSGDEPYAGWDTFAELPEGKVVRLRYGDYTAAAWWGQDFAAAFDSPYFYGEQKFTLATRDEVTPVNITTRLANAQLKVVYDDSFLDVYGSYKSYRIDVYTDYTSSPVAYASDETRQLYFKVSKLHLRLVMESQDGKTYDYGFDDIEDVQARDSYTFTVKSTPAVGDAGITISIDESTREVNNGEVVPFEQIFTKQLKIRNTFTSGFSDMALFPKVDGRQLGTYIFSTEGIEDIFFYPSGQLASDAGLPSEVSFKAMATDPDLTHKMSAIGFEWDIDIIGSTETQINYDNLLSHLQTSGMTSYTHEMKFKVVDTDGSSKEQAFSIISTPLEIAVADVKDYTIWTKEALVPVISSTEYPYADLSTASESFDYQYSIDNGQTWKSTTEVSGLSRRISGLNPNTTVNYRVVYGRYVTAVKSFVTEADLQLNNNTLETWGSKDTNNQYLGGSENEYWATYNTRTTSSGINAWYTKNSGTRVESKNGSNCAKIMNIGWGDGNTWAGYKWSAVVKNVSAGQLFLGSMNSSGTTTIYGRPLGSRPTSISFNYEYSPKNSSKWKVTVEVFHQDASGNRTVVGTASYQDGSSVSGMPNKELTINYSNTNLKATHIYVHFTNNVNGGLDKDDIDKKSDPNRWEGAPLYIDNIMLNYSK